MRFSGLVVESVEQVNFNDKSVKIYDNGVIGSGEIGLV
jgi:hypothetical protein